MTLYSKTKYLLGRTLVIPAALCVSTLYTTSVAPIAAAGGLDAGDLPSDSRYYLHIDVEALVKSGLADSLIELDRKKADQFQQYVKSESAIDVSKITSLTIYGSEFEADAQTIVIKGEFDRAKIVSKMTADDETMVTKWKGKTFYSVSADKPGEEQPKDFIVGFASDQVMLVAPTVNAMRASLKLLSGESDSLKGSDSPLLQDPPAGSFIYAVAFDLNDLRQYAPLLPVLRQHEEIQFAFGKSDEKFFKKSQLTAQNEDIAEQTKQLLQGVLAYEKILFADSESLLEVIDNAKIDRKGTVTTVDWSANGYATVDALAQAVNRLQLIKKQSSQQ